MTIDIPTAVRENPNLMGMVLKANAIVRQEVGEGGKLRVAWRMDVNAAGRPVLKMTMSDSGRCETPFGISDFGGDCEDLRRRIREWCGQFLGQLHHS